MNWNFSTQSLHIFISMELCCAFSIINGLTTTYITSNISMAFIETRLDYANSSTLSTKTVIDTSSLPLNKSNETTLDLGEDNATIWTSTSTPSGLRPITTVDSVTIWTILDSIHRINSTSSTRNPPVKPLRSHSWGTSTITKCDNCLSGQWSFNLKTVTKCLNG